MEDELILYFVINSELNMSPGKIAVQCCHVMNLISKSMLSTSKGTMLWYKWVDKYNQKKVVLRGKQKDLEKLVDQGFYYIKDIGLNEVEPNSLTAVGLGVMWKSEAQKYIKRLQLL